MKGLFSNFRRGRREGAGGRVSKAEKTLGALSASAVKSALTAETQRRGEGLVEGLGLGGRREGAGGISKGLSGLGGAGSMTPPALEVGPLGLDRGGLHRGRPTLAKEDKRDGELSFFMQKKVSLSRFQSWSYAGGDSC
jgi:hypothetical protein